MIAVAGMGYPWHFAKPELAALVRELVWSLRLMAKKHLATVLIGSGNGNLSAQAVESWLQGARAALEKAVVGDRDAQVITFVEASPRKCLEIHEALEWHEKAIRAAGALYRPPAPHQMGLMRKTRSSLSRPKAQDFPRQLIVGKVGGQSHFSAITGDSVVPECRIPYKARRVREQQEQVIGAPDRKTQVRLGASLLGLLVPLELRETLQPSSPLVMICDGAATQVAWEMIALEENTGPPKFWNEPENSFLGLARGLTRQIKIRGARQPFSTTDLAVSCER